MEYPSKIEYQFITDSDIKIDTILDFWEVSTMKNLLDSMNITYKLKKKLTYRDKIIDVSATQEIPFNLVKGDVVSIYGASGKTATLYALADTFRRSSVLCSTTTKMFYPMKHQVDQEVYNKLPQIENGITFYANTYDDTKCQSPSFSDLNQAVRGFDYAFIESDGTKRRPLKYYREDEPIHISSMNKGIIVCSLDRVNEVLDDSNVHRLDDFCGRYGVKQGDLLTTKLFARYLSDVDGVMKKTQFHKLLFFNKIESYEQYELMLDVVYKLSDEFKSNIDIWFGSAHLNVFEHLKGMEK